MDWDGGLINCVTQSADAFDQASHMGIRSEVLAGSGRIAWEFIEKYRKDHGSIPGLKLVEETCGIPFRALEGTALTYIIEKILGRDLFNTLRDGVSAAQKDLENMKTEDALIKVEHLVDSARRKRAAGINLKQFTDLGEQVIEMYLRTKRGEIGVPLPWPSMNDMTMGLWPQTLTFFAARPGTGKCVDVDTEIPSPVDGVYRTIRDVCKRKLPVFTRSRCGHVEPVMPALHLDTGRKKCLRIKTRSGLELVETPEHPLMTVDGWNKTDELSVGDYIETVKWMPEPSCTEDGVRDELVDLVAGMLAEGGCTTDPPKFANEDPEIVSRIRSAVEMLGAEMVQYKSMEDFEYALTTRENFSGGRKAAKNPVRFELEMWGIGYEKSIHKKIPNRVFGLDNVKLARFIGMFWSCDGTARGGTVPLEMTLGSGVMVKQMKRLLLRFGITSRVAYKTVKSDGKVFDAWRLTVHSTCIDLFRNQIPLVGNKAREIREIVVGNNPNVDNVPITPGIAARIYEAANRGRENGASMLDVAERLGMSSYMDRSRLVRRKTISKRVLWAFADVFGDRFLKDLCFAHWDEIVEIEDAGEREVRDLTVPGTCCFIANDIVAHNTFAITIILRHAWQEGYRVLMVSPEMSAEEIAERGFSIQLHTCYRDIVSGSLGEFREDTFFEGIRELKGMDGFYILDATDKMEPRAIEAAIDIVKPDVVGMDSVYMIRSGPGNRYDRMLVTVDWLREVAKRKDIPVIALTQFNKEAANRKHGGTMETFAMTDTITWDAHNLFGLKQDEDMKKDKRMEFMAIKVRRPAFKQNVHTNWDFDIMDFSEIGKDGQPRDMGYDDDEVPF